MKKPILAIVTRTATSWHTDSIADAARAEGFEVRTVNPTSESPLGPQIAKAGDVILWRASSLDHSSERASVLPYLGRTIMVNETLFRYPMAAYKYFQQNMLLASPVTKKYAIPTFRAKTRAGLNRLLEEGSVELPFIAKPNKGAQGEGVELLKTADDVADFSRRVKLSDFIFQNFIENDGDWRVIVIGGRPLGAIKRMAQAGSHLNNISQGASAKVEDDDEIRKEVYDIALKAASVFDLRFCGVDVIRDKRTGAFAVLEVNTAPQWDGDAGFQAMTGVNVGREFARYARSLYDRKHAATRELVEEYYKAAIGYDPTAHLHFASRLWLWSRDDWARDALDGYKASYIGETPEQIRATLAGIAERARAGAVTVNEGRSYRRVHYAAHPSLPLYNALLFKVILCDSVYGLDIRPYVRELVSDRDLIAAFNALVADHDAIRALSTHAVNFFYLLKNYFKGQIGLGSAVLVDPDEIMEIARGYDAQVARGELKPADAVKLRIYMLTHAVIGESRFYQARVRDARYKPLLRELETIIRDNYADISLDNKCEFLVCARLCRYASLLAPMITGEADASLSWAGNFIADTYNKKAGGTQSLRLAEHRNVLYLMMTAPFTETSRGRTAKVATKASGEPAEKIVLGRLARVSLPDVNVRRAIARVDTGATSSSLHATDVREDGGRLLFKLVDPQHTFWTGEDIAVTDYKKTAVRSASGDTDRYAVELSVVIDGFAKKVLFTLTDRADLLYPVLLGRNFIRGDFVVDIDRQFQERSTS